MQEQDRNLRRCAWAQTDPMYCEYHDKEWGRPIYEDQKLFEFLILEGAQAGLSWITILKKRENYRASFDDFNPEKVACYEEERINEILQNSGIIRNRFKVNSAVTNAKLFLETQKECGSFSNYLWGFVEHKPIRNHFKSINEVPTCSLISEKLSKDLKKRGFKFVGPFICYAFMQAVGMVNDHTTDCFLYNL